MATKIPVEAVRQFRACLLFNAKVAAAMLLKNPSALWRAFLDEVDESDPDDATVMEEAVAGAIDQGQRRFLAFIRKRLTVDLKEVGEKEESCRACLLVALAQRYKSGSVGRNRSALEAATVLRNLLRTSHRNSDLYRHRLEKAMSLLRGPDSGSNPKAVPSPV